MKIVEGFPPNIDKIRAAFKLSGQEIFTWGDIIYNPLGGSLSVELSAHEGVHQAQQNGDPESWWDRYLVDSKFRLEQELEAHRVEYKTFCARVKDRNQRNRFLITVATRLASPMYGNVVSHREAIKLISF